MFFAAAPKILKPPSMTRLGLIPEETLAVLCDVNALAAVVREVSLAVNRLEIAVSQETARALLALRD